MSNRVQKFLVPAQEHPTVTAPEPTREENEREWQTRFDHLLHAAAYQKFHQGKISRKIIEGILWMIWVKDHAIETGDPTTLDANMN